MADEKPVYFDLDTVALLRATLDDAWSCLPLQQQPARGYLAARTCVL